MNTKVFLPLDSVRNLDSFSVAPSAEVENLGINIDSIESFQVHISNITRILILSYIILMYYSYITQRKWFILLQFLGWSIVISCSLAVPGNKLH